MSIASPHAITSDTATAWPFMRRKSRNSLRSRWASMLPVQTRDLDPAFVVMNVVNLAIGEMNHAIGHARHDGVVRDDDRERAEFAVHSLYGLQHYDPGFHVERAR